MSCEGGSPKRRRGDTIPSLIVEYEIASPLRGSQRHI